MTDQWDGTFGGTRFTVGGTGNRTATVAAAGANITDTIIGTTSHSTGKWYFELDRTSNNGDGFGFGTSAGLSNAVELGHTATSVEWYPTGFFPGWYTNSGRTTTTFPGASTGQRLGLAVDLDAGKAWIRNCTSAPNTWYGTDVGDPVAGTNAFTWTPWAAAVFIGWSSVSNGAGEATTMHVDVGDLTAAPPSGFVAWGSTLSSGSIGESVSAADAVSASYAGGGNPNGFSNRISLGFSLGF